MDRCMAAYSYHKSGFNCAQAVAGAFHDKIGLTFEQIVSAIGGFGGGVGGTHAELCGAISGGVMILSLLYPHKEGADQEAKRRIYALSKEFRRRFEEVFGYTLCSDLLAARVGSSEKTPAAQRLEITNHCDIMIVTAVEILEQMLDELE